jgi:hypothetical protein
LKKKHELPNVYASTKPGTVRNATIDWTCRATKADETVIRTAGAEEPRRARGRLFLPKVVR